MNVSGVLLCQVNIVYPTNILLKTNLMNDVIACLSYFDLAYWNADAWFFFVYLRKSRICFVDYCADSHHFILDCWFLRTFNHVIKNYFLSVI